jgi:DNA-binding protein HU-beta
MEMTYRRRCPDRTATAKNASEPMKAITTVKKPSTPVKAVPVAKKAPPRSRPPPPRTRSLLRQRRPLHQPKKAIPAKAAPQATITLRQIAATLAEGHDLSKKQAEAVLGDLVTLATQHLKKGDKIRLTGLGILQVRAREARTGRNPATGESIEIAASKKIAFRAAKELKEAV